MRGCSDAASGPVSPKQDLGHPAALLFAETNCGQRARNISNHVLQKRVRRHFERDPVAPAIHRDVRYLTNGR